MRYDLLTELKENITSKELIDLLYLLLKDYVKNTHMIKYNNENDYKNIIVNINEENINLNCYYKSYNKKGIYDDYYIHITKNNTILILSNTICEIGIIDENGYYTKRMIDSSIRYAYYDKEALDTFSYLNEIYHYNIPNLLFETYGILPDKEESYEIDDTDEEYDKYIYIFIDDFKNSIDIKEEVINNINEIKHIL